MKKLFLVFFLFNIKGVSAQTMTQVLKLLPKEIFYNVNLDSLIRDRKYYPRSNDNEERLQFTIDLEEDSGKVRIEMSYLSGQAGYSIYEARRWRLNKNESIIVYSQTGGAHNMYDGSIETFKFSGNRFIKTDVGLPKEIELNEFFKAGTPETVLREFNGWTSHSYDLLNNKSVAYVLCCTHSSSSLDQSWLLGTRIDFKFVKGRFVQQKPIFED